MLNKDLRLTVLCLKDKGKSNREISRLLNISRNTVRNILSQGAATPKTQEKTPILEELFPIIKNLFKVARGNVVRVQEMLKEQHEHDISYSTLTRWVREGAFREPPKRSGEYNFPPGYEMQHDTSPHKIKIGEKIVTAQCASLVLAYSRKIFMQYYPNFTRFEAKIFLKEA
ncbi:MAG: helix-turn-helix domain-containing protein, partial [Melioribacteraceae bacterium]|nr:helix-turn-helix domain-containing protein [Melioribacteraceae bacterium]